MEESCGMEGKEQVYKALNGQLFNMDLDLQREAKRLISLLTDKVDAALEPAVLTLFSLPIYNFYLFASHHCFDGGSGDHS